VVCFFYFFFGFGGGALMSGWVVVWMMHDGLSQRGEGG